MRNGRPLVLLLDDDPDDRALARVVLERAGARFVVEEIADAPAFARACGRRSFDLAVLELRLGWADGMAVLGVLREEWPAVPVVVFSRAGDAESAARAMGLGAADYLVKSSAGFLRLPGAVQAALEGGRVQSPQGSNEELRQFASLAAHELQEPVRMMERHSQLLQEDFQGKLDPGGQERLGFVIGAAGRLRRLIDGLLALSRVESRERRLETVGAESLLEAALVDLRGAIAEAGARVTHSPLPEVAVEPAQIVQVFHNLIGNALKFRGPEPPEIHVDARRDGGEWVFSVRDNGIGIDPADAEEVFALFKRLNPEISGTGVGLALCKKIVERHGGRIWVESEPGRGATFFFSVMIEAIS